MAASVVKTPNCARKPKELAKTQPAQISDNAAKWRWWVLLLAVFLITFATRYYKVTEPDHICWDETHFGKMGSWYINRTFFFDVHPPLGKMLIGLSGYLTGYNGTFPFEKPGDKYNETRYQGMRYFCTTLGALIMPMGFDTVYDLTRSHEAAVLSAAYLIFDVGMLTLNQYILLDPILLFFMMGSVWGMVKISKCTTAGGSYTARWWLWLLLTGTMLSCTTSVKFVGLFVVLLVGLHTASELWLILGDLSKPIAETLKQIACRALALILWPIVLYTFFFYIHLSVLNRSGNGDGFYSSAFQSRLIGNSLYNASMPRDVAYGALVTIKNHKTGGGYLHSHAHLYPKGSGARQQQITTYTHKDDNNIWQIKPYNKQQLAKDELRLLRHGDLLRLEHLVTKRNLHSHSEPAPMTKKHLQVTGYGELGVGDANDVWRVLIVGGRANDTIHTVTSRLMFVHYLQNCALTSSGKQLPKWGFEQQEVSCNLNIRDKNAHWNVEDNQHKQLPSVSFSIYAPGFFARFLESHAVMLQGNAGLKPKEGEITSRPWQWPINYRGQFFSGSSYRIYLLGNPVIWWSNLVFLLLFIAVYLCNAILQHRRAGLAAQRPTGGATAEQLSTESTTTELCSCCPAMKPTENTLESKPNPDMSLQAAAWLFIGWLLHYLPFWAMGRVLYFHHYFPALIFNSLLTGIMFNYIIRSLPKWLQHVLLGSVLSTIVYSFVVFSPLAYGMNGPLANEPNSTMHSLKWLSTWEF
ncbi:protein O-mannosyl-transferase 2 [Drosophila grimshawi]|uniref:Protein O-mannosyl-transferase 2 n=1 Tax=Drosophila grimshawi TaxID=7222 RepID=B4JWZ9_DROGR|nr:protein O-mannosyl-transferase 2 [Drosophila grimshawi]EDV95275.1 GH17663 [Drosophila grimshawi]